MASVISAAVAEDDKSYRVMVVDDSAVIRGIFRRVLESDPSIKIVASVGNGQFALDSLKRQSVEVVVLDIEMPVMDGMTALPKILEIDPAVKVIMASTLTEKNADISLRALDMGAADYIPKPTSKGEVHSALSFQRELLEKVKALGEARRRAGPPRGAALRRGTDRVPSTVPPLPKRTVTVTLRKPSSALPKVLAIGSSTGGPQALFSFFSSLKPQFDLPILVTQHMPATFTKILAEHIAKIAHRPCTEARSGMIVELGHIYVAPGDFHMTAEKKGDRLALRTIQTAPENFCRPSVDPMLRSLVNVLGAHVFVLILTGMGHDGLEGSRAVVTAGGTVFAQDEATSVVWGMPGSVAAAGLCSAVLPLAKLARHVCEFAGK